MIRVILTGLGLGLGLSVSVAAHAQEPDIEAVVRDLSSSDATTAAGAWAQYGDMLATASLPEAAVLAWSEALTRDATPLETRAAAAMALAQTTGDTAALGEAVPNKEALPAGAGRTTLAIVGARIAIRDGRYADAVALTGEIPGTDPSYVDARVLRGIALASSEDYGNALAALLVADAAATGDRDQADWIKINLARTYYAADNPLRAIEHYVQVSRGGSLWLDAHWERAWAHFVIDDMAGTLSALRAYQTPYLDQVYLAEGDMLRIYAMFLMCKFPSAKVELDGFQARYQPMLRDLNQSMTTQTPESAWQDHLAWRGPGDPALPDSLHAQFEREPRMADALRTLSAIDTEQAQITTRALPWTGPAAELLTQREATLITREGTRILDRGRAMQTELSEWLGNADITRLDILEYERKLLERAAITGEVDLGDRLGELRGLRKRRGTRVWPGSEEVWADEVGYESVRTRSDCREDIL